MERLTDKGDGHTTYVSDETRPARSSSTSCPPTSNCAPATPRPRWRSTGRPSQQFRLIGYENRRSPTRTSATTASTAARSGPGHTVTALYAVRLRRAPPATWRRRPCAGSTPRPAPARADGPVGDGAIDGALWGASNRLQVTAVAAYFAEALRGDDTDHPARRPVSANWPTGQTVGRVDRGQGREPTGGGDRPGEPLRRLNKGCECGSRARRAPLFRGAGNCATSPHRPAANRQPKAR